MPRPPWAARGVGLKNGQKNKSMRWRGHGGA